MESQFQSNHLEEIRLWPQLSMRLLQKAQLLLPSCPLTPLPSPLHPVVE